MPLKTIKVERWSKPVRRIAAVALCLLPFATAPLYAQETAAAPPKMQLPADQREYKEATAVSEPSARLTALRQFVKKNPDSIRVYSAQAATLETLIKFFPERTGEIDQLAREMVDNPGKNVKKYLREYYIAGLLAEAEPKGVDLPIAEEWAKDAVHQLTEESFDEQAKAMDAKSKEPPPTPEARHRTFAKSRANALASLANVYLDEGHLQQASETLAEAYALSPQVSKLSLLMGRIALLEHHDAEALSDFERAQLLGELRPPWREKMVELYAKAHGDSDAGLTENLDQEYAKLSPPPFTPEAHQPLAGNHTVLLELFTGSGCPPCVADDLAAEAMLKAYNRKEVIILEQDEHIPEPDPLANPDGVSRGAAFEVAFTPTLVMDGKKLPLYGGTREDSQELYGKLTKLVDAEQSQPSPVQLTVTATRDAAGLIHAQAHTSVPSAAPGDKAQAIPGDLAVSFALVEDDVRYSGENGIRFHRMVVRSIITPDGKPAFLAGSSSTLGATMDPAAISKKWADYLSVYEDHNDRYGKITFLSKDTSMKPQHLAVVAWVQDPSTHKVLQAAFTPVALGD